MMFSTSPEPSSPMNTGRSFYTLSSAATPQPQSQSQQLNKVAMVSSYLTNLQQLGMLHRDGVIDTSEFQRMKFDILHHCNPFPGGVSAPSETGTWSAPPTARHERHSTGSVSSSSSGSQQQQQQQHSSGGPLRPRVPGPGEFFVSRSSHGTPVSGTPLSGNTPRFVSESSSSSSSSNSSPSQYPRPAPLDCPTLEHLSAGSSSGVALVLSPLSDAQRLHQQALQAKALCARLAGVAASGGKPPPSRQQSVTSSSSSSPSQPPPPHLHQPQHHMQVSSALPSSGGSSSNRPLDKPWVQRLAASRGVVVLPASGGSSSIRSPSPRRSVHPSECEIPVDTSPRTDSDGEARSHVQRQTYRRATPQAEAGGAAMPGGTSKQQPRQVQQQQQQQQRPPSPAMLMYATSRSVPSSASRVRTADDSSSDGVAGSSSSSSSSSCVPLIVPRGKMPVAAGGGGGGGGAVDLRLSLKYKGDRGATGGEAKDYGGGGRTLLPTVARGGEGGNMMKIDQATGRFVGPPHSQR